MQPWSGERLEPFVFNEATLEHLHRYALASELVQGKTVLDIACGEGYGTRFLAADAAAVTGIDIDASTIKKAQATYQQPNLQFKRGSITQIPEAANSFDMVVSFETLEHVADHEAVLRDVKRVLKENGLFIVSTPDKKAYTDATGYRNPHHQKELYEGEFKSLLQQHFQNLMFLRQTFVQGSLVFPEGVASGFKQYTGDYNSLLENRMPASYWIALASDGALPPVRASLFYNEAIRKMILEGERDTVRKTASYQVGNFFLRPFKALRKWLR